MVRIAVVDDNKEMAEIIKQSMLCEIRKDGLQDEIKIKCYHNASLLKYDLEEDKSFMIYFLDIEMPGINGIELAKQIREYEEDAYIVFITSYENYAFQSYDIGIRAYHYILKSELKTVLPRILKELLKKIKGEKDQFYYIFNNTKLKKLRLKDIVNIYKNGKRTVFVTDKGLYDERKTLGEVLAVLDDSFLKIDRSNIINIMHIEKIEKNMVYMDNNNRYEISRANVCNVKKRVALFWKEHI